MPGQRYFGEEFVLPEVTGVGMGQRQLIGASWQRQRLRLGVSLRGGHLPGQGTALSKTGCNWRSIAGFNDPAGFISRNVKYWSRK